MTNEDIQHRNQVDQTALRLNARLIEQMHASVRASADEYGDVLLETKQEHEWWIVGVYYLCDDEDAMFDAVQGNDKAAHRAAMATAVGRNPVFVKELNAAMSTLGYSEWQPREIGSGKIGIQLFR